MTLNRDSKACSPSASRWRPGISASNAFEKAWSQRVYHYIVGTFSLCGGLGFYTGELMPHKPGAKKGRQDCTPCFRKVEKRFAETAATGQEERL